MKRKRILFIGNFDEKNKYNGQYIRTNSISQSLKKSKYSAFITYADTKKTLNMLLKLIIAAIRCDIIILVCTASSLWLFTTVFRIFKCEKSVIYIAIGNSITKLKDINKKSYNTAIKLRKILVQTQYMKKQLMIQEYHNIKVFPNYRIFLNNNIENKFKKNYYIFCSRICKEKGIEICIESIKKLNKEKKDIYYLDIYGPIEKGYAERFNKLCSGCDQINYKGIIEPSNVVNVLKKYYCLIFPTYYEGEGFPGIILESFLAGTPVIASNWKSNSEIVKNNINGLLMDKISSDNLYSKIEEFSQKKDEEIARIRLRAKKEAEQFTEDKVFPILLNELEKII